MLLQKHAIKFPSEEFALELGLAPPHLESTGLRPSLETDQFYCFFGNSQSFSSEGLRPKRWNLVLSK